MKNYHNAFLWQELYFDVDYCNADYNEGAGTLYDLMGHLTTNAPDIGYSNNPTLVFSGGKGFHLVDTEWRVDKLLSEAQRKEYHTGTSLNDKQEFNRKVKTNIVNMIKEAGILIDFDVTPDPRRIIRLPGTVHGKTLRLCKVITIGELDWQFADGIMKLKGYNPDPPIR